MAKGQHLQILIYHRILPTPDILRPDEFTRESFYQQMAILRRFYHVFDLRTGLALLKAGTLPNNAVAITFDDGYKDNLTVALPILKSFQLPATIFVSTGFLAGGIMWNDAIIELLRAFSGHLDLSRFKLGTFKIKNMIDRLNVICFLIKSVKYCNASLRNGLVEHLKNITKQSTPSDIMLTERDIQILAENGIEIGAHTINHPILSKLSQAEAEYEIADSKSYLQKLLGKPIDFFAYPNGNPGIDYQIAHRHFIAEVGFEAACSTWRGAATRDCDFYQLPRFTPWDKSALKFRLRMRQYRFKQVGRALSVSD